MYVDCGTLVDGTGDVIEDARLRVEDGAVAEVGPREDVAAEGDRVDHSGEVVVPGFVDAHVHVQGLRTMDPTDWVLADDAECAARATVDCRRLLEAGFTSVRDLGSTVALGLRDAIAAGDVAGPRIYTSGRAISQTGGHGDAHFLPHEWAGESGLGIATLADGEAECRKTARRRLRNGVDTIEHGFHLDDEAIDLLLETDAKLVPTLSIMFRIVEEGADHGVPEYGLRKSREAFEAHVESTRRAHEAGVPVATGTDFLGAPLVPHGENALELELLVEEIGLSPLEAIEAATGVAARTVPDDVGDLRTGAHADFVALDADPRDGIEAVREVATVYKGGERVANGASDL